MGSMERLIYGTATLALPYSQTLFGEPLAALLLILAVISAHRYQSHNDIRDAVLAGLCTGLCAGINTIYILFLAVVGEYVLHARWHRRVLLAFIAPAGLIGLMLLGYNTVRFGNPFEAGYYFAEGEGFTRPVLLGLYGLFFSPYRGLMWYSPILWLAVPGILLLRRRDRVLAFRIFVMVLTIALMFAGWWSWDGGVVWGPRFMIPAIPLLAVCLAPVLEAAAAQRRFVLRTVLAVFLTLSLGVTLLGTIYTYFHYINWHLNTYFAGNQVDSAVTLLRDEVLTTPEISPIVGHLAMVVYGWPADLPILQGMLTPLAGALPLILLGLALRIGRRKRYMVGLTVGALVICTVLTATGFSNREESALARELAEEIRGTGTAVIASDSLGTSVLEIDTGVDVIAMNAPTSPDDPLAAAMWRRARSAHGTLWLVSWFGPGDPANWQERDLWANTAYAGEQWVRDHRVVRFEQTPTTATDHQAEWVFGPVALVGYGVQKVENGTLLVVEWKAVEPAAHDLSFFIHLLDANGQIIAQQDRQPQGGYRATSGWRTGETVTDRLFFQAQGESVRIGWVQDGRPLAVTRGDGTVLAEEYVVIAVE